MRVWICAVGVAALAVAISVAEREPRYLSLLGTAAPQDRELFVAWQAIPNATYTVSTTDGAGRITTIDAGATTHRAIQQLTNGQLYTIQITAFRRRRPIALSLPIHATPHERPNCAATNYRLDDRRQQFFCTKAALDTWLVEQGISPLTLTCRNQPVLVWDAQIPNCLYRSPMDDQLLLLRSADTGVTSFDPPADRAAVRVAARTAIWGQQPFAAVAETAEWTPISAPAHGFPATVEAFRVTAPDVSPTVVTFVTPPAADPARVAIYHEGHVGPALTTGADLIQWLLDRGWTVVALDMPLFGLNPPDPAWSSHDHFAGMDGGETSPLAVFLAPVKAVVDRLMKDGDPLLLLAGRSGGGWTAYTYGALDPRVDLVVSIAGGRPVSQRLDAPWGALELGDYEQREPTLYDVVSHEALMIAAGARGAFYGYGRWDPCCFQVTADDPFLQHLQTLSTPERPLVGFSDPENRQHGLISSGFAALDAFLQSVR